MNKILFDPLLYLEQELRCKVILGSTGKIRIQHDRIFSERSVPYSRRVIKLYEKLLVFQIQNSKASVQKLIAHGKLRVKDRRYVVVGVESAELSVERCEN